ncbi:pyruvate kinase [bacterium]|nr:pyruvate kinase [bacterium]
MRKTKIVCTIGPASSSPDRIRDLILAGMDVARLNFSHGDCEEHRKIIRSIRQISRELGRETGILQDLGGPKIRLGILPVKERELKPGEKVILGYAQESDSSLIPVNYPYLAEDINVGDPVLMADGLVELKVEEKRKGLLICRVFAGGLIHSHKGINLPSSALRVSAFTEKDRGDLTVGLEEGVDFVALSFVRSEQDLEQVIQVLRMQNPRPMLIAKIETPQSVQRFEGILAAVDGVMIARGDLGVEMPLEEVPIIQKRIIRLTRQSGKPVITATQMLRSMVSSPRPTRAEATDAANAILDGTDALMLSEETAMGDYPLEAVAVLDRIALATEPYLKGHDFLQEPMPDFLPKTEAAISRSACFLAIDLNAPAIVACTTSGGTARLVSRFRPDSPIVALTPNLYAERQLRLSWGVIPSLVEGLSDTDQMFSLASAWVIERGIAKKGDNVIVTAGIPINIPGATNLLRVIEIKY